MSHTFELDDINIAIDNVYSLLCNIPTGGLIPMFGSGRSGKSTLATNIVNKYSEIGHIKCGEFDADLNIDKHLIDSWEDLDDLIGALINRVSVNKIIIIDSFRDLLYGSMRNPDRYTNLAAIFNPLSDIRLNRPVEIAIGSKDTYRAGGISNQFTTGILRLALLARYNDVRIIPIINPITHQIGQIKELIAMLDSCSMGLFVIRIHKNYTRQLGVFLRNDSTLDEVNAFIDYNDISVDDDTSLAHTENHTDIRTTKLESIGDLSSSGSDKLNQGDSI